MMVLRSFRRLSPAAFVGWFAFVLFCLPVPAQTGSSLQGPFDTADEILSGDEPGPGTRLESLPPGTSVSATVKLAGGEKESPAGEPFEIVLELRIAGEAPPVRLMAVPELDLSTNLERIKTSSGNRQIREGDGVTEIHFIRYTLQGNAPGEGTIQPAEIEYRFPGDEQSRTLPVSRLTVSIGPAAAHTAVRWKLLIVVGISAAALGGAVLIGIVVLLIVRKGRSAGEEDPGAGAEPAWKRELDEARRKRFEGDSREYLRDLYDVLRRGMAERSGLPGSPTVENLKRKIEEKAAEGSSLREAVRLLEELDAARYAPETPPLEDLDRTAKRIEELLENDRG